MVQLHLSMRNGFSIPEDLIGRHARIGGQATVGFGVGYIVQHVHHAGSADARRIAHARVREAGMLPQLSGSRLGQSLMTGQLATRAWQRNQGSDFARIGVE
jgi:hypothetical protein